MSESRQVAQHAPVGLAQADAHGSLTYVNDQWFAITGLPADQALGTGWAAAVHPDDRDRILKAWQQAFDERREFAAEFRVRRPDGEARWVIGHARPEPSEDGLPGRWVGAIVDVTERKRLEQRLGEQLFDAQESERRALARELHDHVGQELTALKMLLRLAQRDSTAREHVLKEAGELVDELVWRVRGLSLDLRPTVLDDLGLRAALEAYFERYTARTNIGVRFEHGGLEARLPHRVETAAYRIVQEALTNVTRHSRGRHVSVRVVKGGTMLVVQIEDQGAGFAVETALASGASSGLSGMRERADLLGGHLTIESQPGQGTMVTGWLPVNRTEQGHGAA
ncbi:MAG TPA: PAS domain-containing sensor histidine kinase [Methylomirabilota bacterium]|nr:PAS domain-containing sensor histidine kinase [Methylomirabilota bacterium]